MTTADPEPPRSTPEGPAGAPADGDARARARAEQLVGRTIDGRYRIDAVLAMGGMGAVYEGRHLKLKKRVALKVLHPDVEGDVDLVRRFEREALAGAQVSHPHVACATDFGELPDGTRFLVMEHVRGTTLRELLEREGPLPAARAARIARQIAVALGEIHGKGIVHRDLKPRNVMLAADDFVKVVDFGLAKVETDRVSTMSDEEAEDDARLTAAGVVFGTFGHLAPEAAFGMDAVDARADLYALGVMLYEMLAGKHPFEAKTDLELFTRQRTRRAPPFAERAPGVEVSPALESVVLRLLEREPADRYPDAAQVIAAIDDAEPSASHAPPPPAAETVAASMRPGPGPSERPRAPDSRAPDDVERAVRKMWAPLADTARRSALRSVAEVRGGPDEPREDGTAAVSVDGPRPPGAGASGGGLATQRGATSRRLGFVLAGLLLLVSAAIVASTCGEAAGPAAPPGQR